MLSQEQQEMLFQDAPDQPLWIGNAKALADRIEAVPFKYDALRYVMVFMHPVEYIGGEAELPDYSRTWADGYMPNSTVRLVKFLRAEAVDELFTPSAWPLRRRNGIFELGSVLRDAWAQHQASLPETQQYFYMATDERLGKFYGRIFTKSSTNGILASFEPILEPLGDFYGYRKKT
jgi:hypothetical protein